MPLNNITYSFVVLDKIKLIFFNVFIIIFFSKLIYAADCTAVNGNTVTISSNCTNLEVSGEGSNVTVDTGVTVSASSVALESSGSETINAITNNGTISVSGQAALQNSTAVTTLTNSGQISASSHHGLKNASGGIIGTLNNSGTISSTNNHNGLYNFNSAVINVLNNSGTISASKNKGLLNNTNALIVELNNSGTISSGQEYGLRNANGASITTLTNSGNIQSNRNGLYNTSTITTIINESSGNIKALNGDYGLKNPGGTIGTLNNLGTISSTSEYGVFNSDSGVITTLLNSGTISSNRAGLWNESTITTLTNTGNIKALNGNFGLKNVQGASIGTLSNSGEISATGDYGIVNDNSTIGTLVNTGTISGGNSIGIYNDGGTITTLNNLQGASSSALTYKGALSTNYNAIVNSTSDYGKVVFSNKSGTTTFGVDITSTLTGSSVNTTYSDVISGLTEDDLESCTSDIDCITGNKFEGTNKYNWKLDDTNGDDDWDLIITSIASSIPTAPELPGTPTLESMNSLKSVTDANFAHMNTYDCDFFGNNNDSCLSLGARRSEVTSPSSTTDGIVLVAGKKYSDYLRFGGFYHTNTNHNTSKNLKLSDKTPLLGSLIVWNQKRFGLGFQVKYANAYQEKNATITREAGDNTEEGTGTTTTSAISNTIESRYIFSKKHKINYIPYFAARHAIKTQDSFTEVGPATPLTYNTIKDDALTILLGSKFDSNLTPALNLHGSLGIEHDIYHTIDKLEPTGMSGLPTVNLDSSLKKTRPVVSLGFDYDLSSNQRFSGVIQYQELPFEGMKQTNIYYYYSIAF